MLALSSRISCAKFVVHLAFIYDNAHFIVYAVLLKEEACKLMYSLQAVRNCLLWAQLLSNNIGGMAFIVDKVLEMIVAAMEGSRMAATAGTNTRVEGSRFDNGEVEGRGEDP